MMDWTCGWLIETWLDTPKLGKTFFQLFCLWNLLQYWKKKVWAQIFDLKKQSFGGHLIWNMFRKKTKLLSPIFSSNFLHRCVKILQCFHRNFSLDSWAKNLGTNFCRKNNFVFFNDCLVQTCAYVSFRGKQLVESISENSF